MKHTLIIGNWKSHKTVSDVRKWFAEIASEIHAKDSAEVILCPSYQLLPICQEEIRKYQLPWKLGAQNVSPFPEGKHTGEVNAAQLKDFVQYVIIGHSERRNEFNEVDALLFEKVKRVQEVGLTPIFFVPGDKTPIPHGIEILAYEPVFAIGTGHPDTPEDAEKVASFFKTEKKVPTVLYGGSVDDKNVNLFMSCSSIDGIVPGTASLDSKTFARLIHNA